MKVLVTSSNKTFTVDFNQNDSVRLLKLQISIEIDQSVETFRLLTSIHSTKVLMSEDWPLSFYSVSEIEVVSLAPIQKPFHRSSFSTDMATKLRLRSAISSIESSDYEELVSIIAQHQEENLEERDLSNICLPNKWTLVHYASFLGRSEILQYLLNRPVNVNVNKVTKDEWTPLQLSIYCRHSTCATLLLQHPRIQINKKTRFRGTPIHLACENNNYDLVELLLKHQPSLSLEDHRGRQAVEVTSSVEILERLAVHAGSSELQKYKTLQAQVPSDFGGDVWLFNQFFIYDKFLFLYMNVNKGKLEMYNHRDQFLDRKPPDKTIQLADIQDLEKSQGSFLNSQQFYFVVTAKKKVFWFYTKHETLTEEWLERLRESVNYCLIYNSSERPEIEVSPDREPVREKEVWNEQTIKLTSFDMLEQIGAGGFGEVYKVRLKSTQGIFAMKMLDKMRLQKQKQLKYAISECRIMKQLDHPFVMKLHYAFQTHKYLFLVLEYCPEGDLLDIIEQNHFLSENLAKFYLAQIILALECLHSLDILYRDMKPANVLIAEDGYIRLGDFGLAKENVSIVNPALTLAGSISYLPPEILNQKGASQASDIYGLGVTLYEMLVGKPPRFEESIHSLLKAIDNSNLEFPEWVSCKARDLICSMMHRNPSKRPIISQIKRHSFFWKFDWDALLAKRMKSPRFSIARSYSMRLDIRSIY